MISEIIVIVTNIGYFIDARSFAKNPKDPCRRLWSQGGFGWLYLLWLAPGKFSVTGTGVGLLAMSRGKMAKDNIQKKCDFFFF